MLPGMMIGGIMASTRRSIIAAGVVAVDIEAVEASGVAVVMPIPM